MKYASVKILLLTAIILNVLFAPINGWALASNNIPLDSQVYRCLEKLAGLGLIKSDVTGIKPFSRDEAARMVLEAEENIEDLNGDSKVFASQLVRRIHEMVPREAGLTREPVAAPGFDFNPSSAAMQRYVYFNGVPRSFNRDIFVRGGQSAFGFIGGKLRPDNNAGIAHQSGSEGTPLLENNEGVVYNRGSSAEIRWVMEGFVTSKVSLLAEPMMLFTPGDTRADLQKGYVKFGSGGLELEVGRDENWFGPGYRGALTLSSNARNFDLIKLSSPSPIDVGWLKNYIGDVKYALVFSRFDETGVGADRRQPYFIGIKIAVKPKPWWEVGINIVRQEGGPGFSGSTTLQDFIFGGGYTNHNNTIAGIDLRFRIPWLRNTEVYAEYAGEDSAGFWPFVESYVAGFHVPCLTSSCRDDLRFEFFYGNPMLYTDGKFPAGYVYKGMPVGDSQGGGTVEFFTRYSHWFSPRNNLAVEYFHTERGNEGRIKVGNDGRSDPSGFFQAVERKNSVRGFWYLPIFGDFDMNLMYGWEYIKNMNLVGGNSQQNQVVKLDLLYRY